MSCVFFGTVYELAPVLGVSDPRQKCRLGDPGSAKDLTAGLWLSAIPCLDVLVLATQTRYQLRGELVQRTMGSPQVTF